MSQTNLGCIHLYCGDGKGKTTAAMGLAVRAAGSGCRVLVLQFLKDGKSSELRVLRNVPGIHVLDGQPVKKFTFQMNSDEKQACKLQHTAALQEAIAVAERESTDLLILDECLGAIGSGTLDESVVLDFLRHKPAHLEVVLTGRDPSDALIELADYVSEIRKIKHPFDQGLAARMGIEK